MKVLMYLVAFLGALWLFSSITTIKAQDAYRKGFRDGSRSSYSPSDVQCASWLMQTNIKEAKTRICK